MLLDVLHISVYILYTTNKTREQNMKYLSKDQNYQNETTIYWFEAETELEDLIEAGNVFGIADCNGEKTALDCDGSPIDYNDRVSDYVLNKCIITDEMVSE